MAPTPTPPPPPSRSSSSAPPFKTTNTPSPSPNTAPPQGAPTSPAAATPPPPTPPRPFAMVGGVSEAVIAVFEVSTTLRAQGYLAGQEMPSITLPEERAPEVFDSLLASFLTQSHGPGLLPPRPMPPLLGDGSAVGLLRLYLAVKACGGFDAVPCWATVAEAAGLDPSMDAPIKIVYYKYLCPLEQSFLKARMLREEAESSRRLSAAKKGKFLAPAAREDAETEGGGEEVLDLKRKREKLVGMLNWVRLVAKKPDRRRSGWNAADSHLAMALMFRRQMFEDEGCSDKPHGCASPESDLTTEDGWDDQQSAGGSSNWNSRANRSFGLANIPEWTGKPSVPYEDPDMLRFLGEPILTPKSNEAFDDTIGKGRPDKCNCEFPGSISCVRFHVTEKKTELKHRLGLSYYAMKFDQTGEDAALTWTKDEEKKFETIVQQNLPSSKYKFWDKLHAAFRYKGESALVSYYYNVFQLRRRAFQNRVARHVNGVDSDDDSIEPAFLHLHKGGGKSSSRSSASSGNGNRS